MCSLGYCHAFLLSTAGVDGVEHVAISFSVISFEEADLCITTKYNFGKFSLYFIRFLLSHILNSIFYCSLVFVFTWWAGNISNIYIYIYIYIYNSVHFFCILLRFCSDIAYFNSDYTPNCRSMMNFLLGKFLFFHEIKILILEQVSQCKFRLQLFHRVLCILRDDKAVLKYIKIQSLAKQNFYKLRVRLSIICISF